MVSQNVHGTESLLLVPVLECVWWHYEGERKAQKGNGNERTNRTSTFVNIFASLLLFVSFFSFPGKGLQRNGSTNVLLMHAAHSRTQNLDIGRKLGLKNRFDGGKLN